VGENKDISPLLVPNEAEAELSSRRELANQETEPRSFLPAHALLLQCRESFSFGRSEQ
jgi:hypothetical protein